MDLVTDCGVFMKQVFGIVRYNFFGFFSFPVDIWRWNCCTSKFLVIAFTFFGSAENDTRYPLPADPYYQEKMAAGTVPLCSIGNSTVHCSYAFLYFSIMYAEQLFWKFMERDSSHAWLFQPWQKPAGALYSESYGKHFSLWMQEQGADPTWKERVFP